MAGNCQTVLSRNVADLRSILFWKAVLAEVIGTLILVYVGCSVCLDNWQERDDGTKHETTIVQISLTFGIAVATSVWCIAHVSGGHINPAVTVAMLVTRKITVVKAVLYIFAQCIGAIAGAGIVQGLHPEDHLGNNLGNTLVSPSVRIIKAYGIELMITFVLVFTVFASCDKKRTDLGGSVPLTIGLSVTLCHLFAIKYTGSSMNPARSFGPAVIAGRWENHWTVYWCGPISGGIFAGLLYELVFAADASFSKVKGMMSPGGQDYELTPLEDNKSSSGHTATRIGRTDAAV